MAIWKDPTPPKKDTSPLAVETPPKPEPAVRADAAPSYDLPRAAVAPAPPPARRDLKESLIAAEITIEGKIEGAGHIRIAGRFKGDVIVQGNLAIDAGAKVTGGVKANTVTVGGELEGNIDNAAKVELLETGVLIGDLKAGSLTVAAGSRMRGHAEFGWDNRSGGGSDNGAGA